MFGVLVALVVVLFLAVGMWTSDFVTLQGERTLYTAACVGGPWQKGRCTGRLIAAERFRFRALKAHREVVFWTSGASQPSGRFTQCQIVSGREWRCPANGQEAATVTLHMSAGQPVVDAQAKTLPFHAISKWRWWLLKWGLSAGDRADS